MSLIYALIARKTDVLVEATSPSHKGNFAEVSRKILAKIANTVQDDEKHTYVSNGYTFNIQCAWGLLFLCMAEENCGRRIPFQFLTQCTEAFVNRFDSDEPGDSGGVTMAELSDTSYSLSLSDHQAVRLFIPTLRGMVRQYCDSSSDKVTEVMSSLDEVKEVMLDNIEKVMQRGQAIDELVDKTESLHHTSHAFSRASKRLSKKNCIQHYKMQLIIGLAVMFVLYLIIASFCGFDLRC